MRDSIGILGMLLLAGCAPAPSPASMRAAYTLLAPAPGGGTVALARVIVDQGQPCPRLETAFGPVAMTSRSNPDPVRFPVEVCEAVQPFGQGVTVEGAGTPLPVVTRAPTRIAVLGDTGCGTAQDCADPAAWPFARLAGLAVATRPDLVIHVGDYVYRGTPGTIEVDGVRKPTYDAGSYRPDDLYCQLRDPYVSQNAPGSSLPDSWEAWRADFFAPAAALLSTAPWVVARGNHELCSRAGPGWFFLLDPSSDLFGGELSCPVQRQGGDPLPNLVFAPHYRLELGALRLMVMDTANACDEHANFPERYATQLAELADGAQGGPAWLISHRPIWGVDWLDQGVFHTSNATLQQSIRGSPGGALPAEVELVLSGHIHRFEALDFPNTRRPPQLMVGNSGVSLENDELAGAFATAIDGATARGLAINQFGFLDAQLVPGGGWLGTLVGPGSEVLARCSSGAPGGVLCAQP